MFAGQQWAFEYHSFEHSSSTGDLKSRCVQSDFAKAMPNVGMHVLTDASTKQTAGPGWRRTS